MFVAITTVQVTPGKIDTVLELFKETNPDLVEGQADWVEAKFTANRDEDTVTVLAFWRDAEAYKIFSSSDRFKEVMSRFGPYFAGPPQISVNEILFEM
jgi:heme-degrading monooxygenase HmoA